ncbi:MAG: geranylgeranylglyceryl/heptaprenylglyceryl phosphate synthase [Leeuwenhoekiella sp.]
MEAIAKKTNLIYINILKAIAKKEKLFAILIDPEDFCVEKAEAIFAKLPVNATHIFVGGSTVSQEQTQTAIRSIKKYTQLPLVLFPGSYEQITSEADGILFLSLISGRNPEYLIEQHIQSVDSLRFSELEIIPTGYILIDGGKETAVQRVSKTTPIPRKSAELVVKTALAGQFSGKKMIYLEAGSGALFPVPLDVIEAVKNAVSVPLIVGGGIHTTKQMEDAYLAGADLVVIGTAFENQLFNDDF